MQLTNDDTAEEYADFILKIYLTGETKIRALRLG